ncbi:MAG: hypothetical protein WC722_06320 [Rhodospirillales bacterium]|jgi:hypothetical protein
MTTGSKEDQVKKIAKVCFHISDEMVGIIEFLEAGNTQHAEDALTGQALPECAMTSPLLHHVQGRDPH